MPLQVSRENLQQHAALKTIKKKLVRKALDMIRKLADAETEFEAEDADSELDLPCLYSLAFSTLAYLMLIACSYLHELDIISKIPDMIRKLADAKTEFEAVDADSELDLPSLHSSFVRPPRTLTRMCLS